MPLPIALALLPHADVTATATKATPSVSLDEPIHHYFHERREAKRRSPGPVFRNDP